MEMFCLEFIRDNWHYVLIGAMLLADTIYKAYHLFKKKNHD